MFQSLTIFIVILTVTDLAWSSPAEQCDGEHFEGLQERIQVIPCGKTKCILPKEQNCTMILKFKPKFEVKTLINDVHAIIGIPLPFVGIHGTNACNNIYHAGGKQASCPLKANQEYIYTTAVYLEPYFPEIPVRVRWGLNDGDKKVICFEIPAIIVRKKKPKKLSRKITKSPGEA